MSWWRQLTRGLRALADREGADRDVADEVQHYLDEAAAGLEAGGHAPDEARRLARAELGSAAAVHQRVRESRWEHAAGMLIADVRYAARRLRRSPMFTLAAALTLACGIGASTAIFSAVNPLLLRPLPYPDATRVLAIWDGWDGTPLEVTFGTYREVAARSRTFESLAVARPYPITLTGVDEPERLDGQLVSADYFRVLGIHPALGRDFTADDDRTGAAFVALISDTLWRRRFGADRDIVGRPILLDDTPVTVIGVLPPAFEDVLAPSADFWAPLQYDPALPLDGREWGHHLRMIGRLTRGLPGDEARRELDAVARTPLPDFPRPPWASLGNGFIVRGLQDDLTRGVRPLLLALTGAVGLLLAIACVNVTNLLLARGAGRREELTLRAALGASRARLVRPLIVEALLLGTAGGMTGVLLAHAAVDVLVALAPPGVPRAAAIGTTGWTLAFSIGLSLLVGLLVALLPARDGVRATLDGAGPRQSSGIAGRHRLTRSTLVVAQVALALVLLVCAGLLLRSVERLLAVPPGFNPERLLTLQVQTAGARFRDDALIERFFADVLDAVHGVPGVAAAAVSSQLPLTGDQDLWGVHLESTPPETAELDRSGYRHAVSPGYFRTMGIPLRRGRVLDDRDTAGAPAAVVVNESFAARRLPGVDPIGQRLRIGPADSGPWFTIVGIAGDVAHTSLEVTTADAVYVTTGQWERFTDRARWLAVRSQGDPSTMVAAIREAVRSIDPGQPIVRVATMDERVRTAAAERRFALRLFQAFGLIALLLAATGSYSLLASSVTERSRELAVRAALGASRRGIVTLVLRDGLTRVGLGIAIGAAGASVATGGLETLLFGISRLDPVTYAGGVFVLVGVSIAACAVPAWRAARLDPNVVLRAE